MTIDLTTFTDDDLEEHRLAVVQEQIRRQELAALPTQVDVMIQRFVDHGGDKTKIKNPQSYTRNPNAKPKTEA